MEIALLISLVIGVALLLSTKNKTIAQEHSTKTEALPFKQDIPISIMGESKPVVLKQSLSVTNQIEQDLDLELEEQELSATMQVIDQEFTERVTIDELNNFVRSIDKELLDEATVKTAKKMEGSELLELLEKAMPDSAKAIAKLLDQSLSEKSPKKEEAKGSDDFNINDFI